MSSFAWCGHGTREEYVEFPHPRNVWGLIGCTIDS
jgi:hypothetical protein